MSRWNSEACKTLYSQDAVYYEFSIFRSGVRIEESSIDANTSGLHNKWDNDMYDHDLLLRNQLFKDLQGLI